jgi:hypothetical protein
VSAVASACAQRVCECWRVVDDLDRRSRIVWKGPAGRGGGGRGNRAVAALATTRSFGEHRATGRELLVRVGVVAAAMTLAAGCGAKEQLRPQPRPDPSPGYDVTADVPANSGLRVGAKVTLEGVTAGRVTRVEADGPQLVATLRIRSRYAPLDVDTQAVVPRRSSAPREACVVLIPGHHGEALADESPVRPRRDHPILRHGCAPNQAPNTRSRTRTG